MVLIHYKKSDTNQFLYKTTAPTPITELIDDLVKVHNLRLVLDRLAISIEDLALYGPMKPEALRGLKDPELMLNAVETLGEAEKKYARKMPVGPNMRINEDPNHYRCGIIHNEQV
jgi:hypothetical protein